MEKKITGKFLEEHGFHQYGQCSFCMELAWNYTKYLLVISIEDESICLIKDDISKQTVIDFKSGFFTEERLKFLYIGLTSEELELKPVVTCTEKDLHGLSFKPITHGMELALPYNPKSHCKLSIIVHLKNATISLRSADEIKYNDTLIENQTISVQRIKELYLGLTGKELINN